MLLFVKFNTDGDMDFIFNNLVLCNQMFQTSVMYSLLYKIISCSILQVIESIQTKPSLKTFVHQVMSRVSRFMLVTNQVLREYHLGNILVTSVFFKSSLIVSWAHGFLSKVDLHNYINTFSRPTQ